MLFNHFWKRQFVVLHCHLLTITRKEDFSSVTFLSDSESSLDPYHFLEVSLPVSETSRNNVIQVPEKCWSALNEKMRTPKLLINLKKIITKRMIYMQNAKNLINLFKVYERLKSPPPFTVHFLLVTRFPCFQIWA